MAFNSPDSQGSWELIKNLYTSCAAPSCHSSSRFGKAFPVENVQRTLDLRAICHFWQEMIRLVYYLNARVMLGCPRFSLCQVFRRAESFDVVPQISRSAPWGRNSRGRQIMGILRLNDADCQSRSSVSIHLWNGRLDFHYVTVNTTCVRVMHFWGMMIWFKGLNQCPWKTDV